MPERLEVPCGKPGKSAYSVAAAYSQQVVDKGSQRFSGSLSSAVAGVSKPAGDVGCGDCVQCGGDRGVQRRPGARGGRLDQRLDLAEGLLDRGQIRRVGGQEHQLTAGGGDQLAD